MDLPKEHRVKIRSTSKLKRFNDEVKRRAAVAGIFPNEAAIRRLVSVLLLERNDEYAPSGSARRAESGQQSALHRVPVSRPPTFANPKALRLARVPLSDLTVADLMAERQAADPICPPP